MSKPLAGGIDQEKGPARRFVAKDDYKKKKELEEARKAGQEPAEVDVVTGRDVRRTCFAFVAFSLPFPLFRSTLTSLDTFLRRPGTIIKMEQRWSISATSWKRSDWMMFGLLTRRDLLAEPPSFVRELVRTAAP